MGENETLWFENFKKINADGIKKHLEEAGSPCSIKKYGGTVDSAVHHGYDVVSEWIKIFPFFT